MPDETMETADALAAMDTALVEALRAGDAETALAWATTRDGVLGRIAERAMAGVAAAREQLVRARRANDELARAALAELGRTGQELGVVQAQRRLRERVRPAVRGEPRFVSRRA